MSIEKVNTDAFLLLEADIVVEIESGIISADKATELVNYFNGDDFQEMLPLFILKKVWVDSIAKHMSKEDMIRHINMNLTVLNTVMPCNVDLYTLFAEYLYEHYLSVDSTTDMKRILGSINTLTAGTQNKFISLGCKKRLLQLLLINHTPEEISTIALLSAEIKELIAVTNVPMDYYRYIDISY